MKLVIIILLLIQANCFFAQMPEMVDSSKPKLMNEKPFDFQWRGNYFTPPSWYKRLSENSMKENSKTSLNDNQEINVLKNNIESQPNFKALPLQVPDNIAQNNHYEFLNSPTSVVDVANQTDFNQNTHGVILRKKVGKKIEYKPNQEELSLNAQSLNDFMSDKQSEQLIKKQQDQQVAENQKLQDFLANNRPIKKNNQKILKPELKPSSVFQFTGPSERIVSDFDF
ncbi:MAG: hypothetical protein ACXWL5_01845 [Candidatus Chromulinivorax sp.]